MPKEVWFDDKEFGSRGEMFRPVGNNNWRIYVLPKAFKVGETPEEQIEALLKRKGSNLVEEADFSDGKYVLWWTALAEKVHYFESARRSIVCLSTDTHTAECCKQDGREPMWYGMFPILAYLVKPDGSPLDDPAQSIKNASVLLWKVSESRFGQIRSEHKLNPLPESDLFMEGRHAGGNITQLKIRAVRPALVRKSSKAFEHFVKRAQPLWNVAPGRFGRRVSSEEELLEILGVHHASSASADNFDVDDSLLDVEI